MLGDILIGYLVLVNLVSFVMYGIDKRKAIGLLIVFVGVAVFVL